MLLNIFQIAEELKLSSNTLISNLKKYRDFLLKRLSEHKVSTKTKDPIILSPAISTASSISVQENVTTKPSNTGAVRKKTLIPQKTVQSSKLLSEKNSPASVIPFKNVFLQNLEYWSDQVLQYEDKILQTQGKSLIPLDRLEKNATIKLRAIQKQIKTSSLNDGNLSVSESCFSDLFLVELTNWFNTEFFTWVNSMPCGNCGNEDIQTRGGFVDKDVRVEVKSFILNFQK